MYKWVVMETLFWNDSMETEVIKSLYSYFLQIAISYSVTHVTMLFFLKTQVA